MMTALTLTVGFLLLSSFTVMSIIPEPSGELRGGMTLRIHPDQRVELEVSASSVWEMEPWDYSPGFREMSLSATITPSGTDRYESMGTIEMVLNPDYFPDFPDIELNIDSTWDPPQAESSIMLNVPGYIAVEGETTYVTDEEISESTFDMEFSLMIWYDLLPREYIEMMVENFLLLKPELVTQLIDLTDGYIEVEELDVAESDFGLTYASLTLKLTIVGDFVNGMLALYDELEEYFPEAEIDTTMDPEILRYVKSSSSEVHRVQQRGYDPSHDLERHHGGRSKRASQRRQRSINRAVFAGLRHRRGHETIPGGVPHPNGVRRNQFGHFQQLRIVGRDQLVRVRA